MPNQRLECLRCHGRMQPGFLLEGDPGETRAVTRWVEGEPEKSFWMGLAIGDRAVLPVTTYRCERCAYLESYAPAQSPDA